MIFSIIIPVKEFSSYLEESIPRILALDYEDFEVIILPNKIDKDIPQYLKNKKIKIIPTGRVSPAIKRDIGAKNSTGDYLAFIDDDAYPREDWLRVAEELFRTKRVAAIGGPAITPETDSLLQKASGLFFETLLGGGGMAYRYKPAKSSFYVDDYPTVNLIVSKKVFNEVGGFDNEYWPGEDTKFCLDLINKGYKIWYSNRLIVWHHRREIFLPHLRQIGSYGKHRGYFAKKFPKTSFRITYFLPTLFFLGNIILAILSFFDSSFLLFWMVLLLLYFIIAAVDVFIRTRNIILGILTIITLFFSHLTYGMMFLDGILSTNFRSQLK